MGVLWGEAIVHFEDHVMLCLCICYMYEYVLVFQKRAKIIIRNVNRFLSYKITLISDCS